MIDAVDNELRRRFAPLADPADDSDWRDVCPSPRRSLRATLAFAAFLALTIVVTAPAVDLPHRIVRLFARAKPAPPPVTRSFTDFHEITGIDLAAAPRQIIATPAASLWVAPTTSGGVCTLVKLHSSEGAGGECGPAEHGLSVEVSLHGPFSPAGEVLGGPVLLRGVSGRRGADSLRVVFEDGATAAIPLVWVSEPVGTAFFLYAVPREHWRAGHRPTTLTLLSAGGHELAGREITGIP
jgi:hypothetical protein